MSSDSFPLHEISRRRRHSGWREKIHLSVSEISPEIATGLFTHFKNGRELRATQQALAALDPATRRSIWQSAFPGVADVVELAWEHLPAETIARRDGGPNGYGETFTWPLTEQEAGDFKFHWLRKLLIITGPFPDLAFADVIRHLGPISSGSTEESDGDYFKETTGNMYDSDAPAYAASVLLTALPDSQLAREIADILEQQLVQNSPSGSSRAVKTAFLCARRPDLWEKLDRLLAESAMEPGFQASLISSRKGGLPGSWIHLLQTIRDHGLLRFEVVNETIRSSFGIEWQWKSHHRDDLQPWLERWIAFQESAELRAKAFAAADPGEFLLALWGEALTDGASALARIADPATLAPDLRVAAAHFLHACPIGRIAPLIFGYATDPDLRVASIACPLLHRWRHPVSSPDELPARFERLVGFLEALPTKPDVPPTPAPFPTPSLKFGNITYAIANSFPDGAEATIERLLPRMDKLARDAVVSRLNRYRLTEENRGLAKILHGDRPEDFQAWLRDNEGSQLYAQRQLLLKLLADSSLEIAEHAFKAVIDFTLSADEATMLRPILASKSAKKHLFVTHLYAQQPPALVAQLLPGLIASKRVGERLAALEVLRRLAENDNTAGLAIHLWQESGYQAQSADEERARDVLIGALGKRNTPVDPAEVPSLDNAFGLVDPRSLKSPVPPKDHDIILHSPVTVRIIRALDEWLKGHADTLIPSTRPYISQDPERLGDVSLPSPNSGQSREQNLERFPPAAELESWWLNRPAELRDPDNFEMIRLQVEAPRIIADRHAQRPAVLMALFGIDQEITIKSPQYNITRLADWINYLVPDAQRQNGWQDFLIDATESAYTRLEPKEKGWAGHWHQLVRQRLVTAADTSDEILRRIWGLGRTQNHYSQSIFCYCFYEVAHFFRRRIATTDELVWHLVGSRPFKDKYEREKAFNELMSATSPPGRYKKDPDPPKQVALIAKVCARIVELELQRGETPEVWSHAAAAIRRLHGARHLPQLLSALGSHPLTRKKDRLSEEKDLTRTNVLIYLISVCHPAPGDTAEEFARLVAEAGISNDRLLEIALFRPVWTAFIEHTTGIQGLRDAVGWIFAHTRTSDYQWEQNARELWIGELGFQTPISAEELLEGAVDTEWFERVHRAIGPKVWDKLYAAAKFASTGRGHSRVRLFADALLDKTGVPELQKLLEDKGNLDAALALGLVPLPTAETKRRAELLRRYEILQALKARSKKSKAQRRASKLSAFETGVRNLARRAGFSDTLRFEWAMETEAAADFSAGSLRATIDDAEVTLGIHPDGSLDLAVTRAGKALASTPATVKKHAGFMALKERMSELKAQAQRLRPALEDLMVRGVCLTSAEWRKLMLHPLAGPLIGRLVLASDSGLLGFPMQEGMTGAGEEPREWPEPETELHLAHPVDFLPAETWHVWQQAIFDRQITQPFKQVFRELYLPAKSELEGSNSLVTRFKGQRLNSHQVPAILTKRGWNYHPEEGLHRIFRNDGVTVWLNFEEYFHHFNEQTEITFCQLHFTTTKPSKPLAVTAVPRRVFSEVLRDVDLIVSVAHATGSDPEATVSTVETRAALIRETCRLLGFGNVEVKDRFATISGKLGNYRVHLASGIVHRDPGGMLPVHSDPQSERGRIFLPFADDDPLTHDILSRVLLFAQDDKIRDPALAAILRGQQTNR